GAVWSAGYQPTGVEPDSYQATFLEERAEFHRSDGAITTTLEVLVSPEDDAEMRRVSVTNLGARAREVEVTSYAELVLAPPAADAYADGGHRRSAAVQHRGLRARSHLQSQTAGSTRADRKRAPRVFHARRLLARSSPRAGRQVWRSGDVRARGHAVVDACPGAVPPSRYRSGGGPPVPGAGPSASVLRPVATAPSGRAQAQHLGARRPLGSRDLRRPPDRPGPNRRARGSRNRPATPPRP